MYILGDISINYVHSVLGEKNIFCFWMELRST